ncbi:acid protease [Cutaneotrichosporon oleaginosum]|uniref:Acid protease n=1 Tax=Cutaneotrichosporon oleaginosum TaxID=879819 RepID=A0A0J0XS55_9TREE|nr:acid protease [Cutaneotrichosporon oleaginosum]KLT43901.1 acid protease [Cutaneotrichosporon oleaginosum]TXT06360.1 hypothetical protein COLE_05691 [Cutaneotrichosporon oleaginosum]
MKLAVFAILAALVHAAPTKRQEDQDGDVISLDLTYNSPQLVDDEPEIIHKAAKVPHNVPVTDWARELMYSTQIQVGTPPQTVTLHLDTGSGDLAIWNGDNCTMPECKSPTNQPQFHPKDSSTFKLVNTSAPPLLQYGIGFSRGVWAQDRVSLGGFTQEHQNFLAQYGGETGYAGRNVTGLLGMSFGELSVGKKIKTNWIANAIGRFKKPMFSFYLQHTSALANETIPVSTPGGVLTLGGVNKKYFKGKIRYTKVKQPLGFWRIPLDVAKFNGEAITNGTAEAVIDTGTSLIYGPTAIVDQAMGSIPGANKYQGMWRVPCNTTATFSLTFSGKEWTIPPRDFLYVASRADPRQCYTAIVPSVSSYWLVGDSFLKNVYSVFQWKPARVGFAELRV